MLISNCVICKDSISDPVCRNCYIKQIKVLIKDLSISSSDKKIILNRLRTKFPIETTNEIECMLCRKDNVAICRYCFSIMLTNILTKLNFREEMIENLGYGSIYEETSLKRENFLEKE